MKIFREGIIIIGIYLLGEALTGVFGLPIPGNILGMIILLLLLLFKIIKVEQIEDIVNFFLNHLAFFFIPAGVGLMGSLDIIKETGFSVMIICIVTTVIVIITTGKIVQFVSKVIKDKE